ncbi:unnamed protein product, partial [Iphiclides podalirius]
MAKIASAKVDATGILLSLEATHLRAQRAPDLFGTLCSLNGLMDLKLRGVVRFLFTNLVRRWTKQLRIPDYRSEDVGLYARSNHKPVQYQEFIKYAKVRQRYWARNFVGWPRFSTVLPNATHYAIRELEKAKKVTAIVTQNVDRLHHKAGSNNIIELHGSGYIVKCLHCPYEVERSELQDKIMKENQDMKSTITMIRPDGDVELSRDQIEKFKVPLCPECEGPLKPDIVFFGDNVPKHRVEIIRKENNITSKRGE